MIDFNAGESSMRATLYWVIMFGKNETLLKMSSFSYATFNLLLSSIYIKKKKKPVCVSQKDLTTLAQDIMSMIS